MNKRQKIISTDQLIQELADRIPDAIYFKDKKGRLVFVNKAHAAGLGLKPQEVVGKTDFDFFPHEEARLMVSNDRMVMRTRRPIVDTVEHTTRPDGSKHVVSTTKLPRVDADGRIIGIMGVTRDITTRALQEEDRYRVLFETSQNCVFITTKDGRWVDINEAGVKMFGYRNKRELLKTNVISFYANPRDRESYTKKIQKENFVKDYELIFKRKDGKLIWVQVTATARRNANGRIVGYQGTILDITQRKRNEKEKEWLVRHLDHRVKELACLYGIEEIYHKGQLTAEESLLKIAKLVPSSLRHPQKSACRISYRGKAYCSHRYIKTNNAFCVPLYAEGMEVGFVEVFCAKKKKNHFMLTKEEQNLIQAIAERLGDFIERKLMDDALRKTLKELADIKFALDASAIVVIMDARGKVFYINNKFREISGYTRNDIIGKKLSVIPAEGNLAADIRRIVKKGQIWRGEVRSEKKNGPNFWVDMTVIPFLNDRGKPYQYIVLSYDITERKQLEETFKTLPQRILKAQEYERERISREIHDDLGQSLVTLKMIMQSSVLPAAKDKKTIQDAGNTAINYLDKIIQKSRHLAAGLRPSALEVLGLTSAIKALVNEFRYREGFQIKLTCDTIDRIVLKGDPINLYRIIQEALTNIVMHAHATKVQIKIKAGKDELNVLIKDNGRGFVIGKKDATIGLGLSTMKERVALLKGDLNIQSYPDRGTSIKISFPI